MLGGTHADWVPASLAPPVKRGIYSYHGRTGFAVNGVPRCDKKRLLEHLAFVDPGPVLTKKGKPRARQPVRPQDESAEFYLAQMVHYGLEPAAAAATREAAKVALSRAALDVPKAVLDVEAELKTRYDLDNAKMRRAAADKQRAEEAAEEARRKKRAREEDELIKTVLGAQHEEPAAKRAKAGKAPVPQAAGPVNLDAIAGIYTLVAPKVSSNWEVPYDGIVFKLALSPKRSHIWGWFEFGPFEGTLRSSSPLSAPDATVRFHWRGRDSGSGESTFGEDNVGSLTFLAGGKIKGDIAWDCCEGTIAFAGVRTGALGKREDDEDEVSAWKDAYWSLNEQNYACESRGRWGGGGSYDDDDAAQEPNSDTEDEERSENGSDSGDDSESTHQEYAL